MEEIATILLRPAYTPKFDCFKFCHVLKKLILNEVEQRRYKERRPQNLQRKSSKSLFEAFSLATIAAYIREKNPDIKSVLSLIEQKEK